MVENGSERVKHEEALRQSEMRYRMLFQKMLEGFALHEILCDEEGVPEDYRFLAVNPAFEKLTGLKANTIIGRTVLEILPHTERIWIDTYGKVALTGEPALFENYAIELGKYFKVTAFCPSPGQFACFIQDITDMKRAEAALRESENRIQSIFRSAPVGIGVVSNRVLKEANPQLCQMTGYLPEELIGQSARILYPSDEDFDYVGREKYRQIRERGTGTVETRWVRKDGTLIDVLLSSTPIDLNDLVKGVTFTALDITEQKRAVADREKFQMQLAQAQKMESVGRLAGGVAHDFNNMLNVILGYTEMALHDLDTSHPLCADLEEIRKAAERSANLTRQLLAFARKQTIAPVVLNLNETIASMLRMLQRLIGEDIDLLWKPGMDPDPICIDPGQVDQILANLAVNARDAIGPRNGKITIETANICFDEGYCAEHAGFIPGAYVLLAFSDDGCGMDEETRLHIFEPFYTTKDTGKGTGLGLATVYGIIKQNHGFINVYSELDKGTTFRLYFPRHEVKPRRQDSTVPPVPVSLGRNETILLVEDEPAILNLTRTMLERLGFSVLTAVSPVEAIRKAAEYPGEIHVLITDVIMPGMNGRDLAEKLQTGYPLLKCLFMSGYTANVIAHHGVLDEGVNFIQKPFSLADLAKSVRKTLDR